MKKNTSTVIVALLSLMAGKAVGMRKEVLYSFSGYTFGKISSDGKKISLLRYPSAKGYGIKQIGEVVDLANREVVYKNIIDVSPRGTYVQDFSCLTNVVTGKTIPSAPPYAGDIYFSKDEKYMRSRLHGGLWDIENNCRVEDKILKKKIKKKMPKTGYVPRCLRYNNYDLHVKGNALEVRKRWNKKCVKKIKVDSKIHYRSFDGLLSKYIVIGSAALDNNKKVDHKKASLIICKNPVWNYSVDHAFPDLLTAFKRVKPDLVFNFQSHSNSK